jgi:hypothetical protein
LTHSPRFRPDAVSHSNQEGTARPPAREGTTGMPTLADFTFPLAARPGGECEHGHPVGVATFRYGTRSHRYVPA